MVDAVLAGDGLGRVAELAADAAGSPVAIVVPRLGAGGASPGATADLGALRRYVGDRARGRPAPVPPRHRRRGADRVGRRDDRRRPAARRRPTEPEAARVPAPRGGGLAHRGRGRGGQGGGRAEPARLVPGGAARAARRSTRHDVVRRARPAGLRPLARRGRAVRRAHHRPAAPRRRDDRGRVPGRARAAHGARRRARVRAAPGRRRREPTRRPPRASSRRGCSATASSACRRSTPTRPSCGRAIQEAELVLDVLRRSDGDGGPIRRTSAPAPTGCCSACSPRTPRRCARSTRTRSRRRPLRRPVRDRPRRHARGLPRAATAT